MTGKVCHGWRRYSRMFWLLLALVQFSLAACVRNVALKSSLLFDRRLLFFGVLRPKVSHTALSWGAGCRGLLKSLVR